jgi:hypothetical protein
MKPAPPPVRVDDAETIRLLVEGDDEQPCSVTHPAECPHPAAWGWECGICGSFSRFCTGHRDLIDRLAAHGHVFACAADVTHLVPTPIAWGLL